jgi:hypothetical protein
MIRVRSAVRSRRVSVLPSVVVREKSGACSPAKTGFETVSVGWLLVVVSISLGITPGGVRRVLQDYYAAIIPDLRSVEILALSDI